MKTGRNTAIQIALASAAFAVIMTLDHPQGHIVMGIFVTSQVVAFGIIKLF